MSRGTQGIKLKYRTLDGTFKQKAAICAGTLDLLLCQVDITYTDSNK
jgi:hypothetical protein